MRIVCLFNSVFSQRCHKKWLRTEQSVNYWLKHEVICLHFFDSPRKRQTIRKRSGKIYDSNLYWFDVCWRCRKVWSCHCLQKKTIFLHAYKKLFISESHISLNWKSKIRSESFRFTKFNVNFIKFGANFIKISKNFARILNEVQTDWVKFTQMCCQPEWNWNCV